MKNLFTPLLVCVCLIPQLGRAHADAALDCLALAMYWEARGETEVGMLAVGSVIANRVADKRFPNSTCAVVKQGGERPPCQFSWWCDGKSDRPTEHESWRRALILADRLLHKDSIDPTRGALYFHSDAVNPRWKLETTTKIGNHIFYR